MKTHKVHIRAYQKLRKLVSKEKCTTSDNIINVSSHTLTNSEIKLLNKGLSFIPKPHVINHVGLLRDFDQLVRKMRLRYEFRNKIAKKSRFMRKSHYQPPISTNMTLENVINIIKEDLSSLDYEQTPGRNLTCEERRALTALRDNNSLVINKADKGSTIVVQNHSDYATAGFKHLSDDKVYKPLNADITPDICLKLEIYLKRLYEEGLISKEMMDYCSPPTVCRTARIYFLLKVHKNPMGIRPIVSSVNYVTEPLSQFVDIWLQPLMQKLPSFVRDTNHLIQMISQTSFHKDVLLASIDVTSLYTNIVHEDGIKTIIEALENSYHSDEDSPPPETIGDMLRFILTHNCFEFEGKFYLQLQGCTMGSKCSPSYACIYMGAIEQQLQQMGNNKIVLWKRYIDDIFVIYNGSHTEFEQYVADINLLHNTIKFTFEADLNQIAFLDTYIYKGPDFENTGVLDVKTHVKPTNKQLYVHATSYHPKGCKTGIVTGEALRYLRTNSQESNYTNWILNHKLKLKSRGYKPSLINKLIEPITFEKRNEALTPKPKQKAGAITFVNTYNDMTPHVRQIIHDRWKQLHTDPILKRLFPEPPIMALKRNKNLSNWLVKSKPDPWIPPNTEVSQSPFDVGPIHRSLHNKCVITKCDKRTCKLCPILSLNDSITSRVSRRKHRIFGNFSCSTSRLVYLLECTKCGKQYVGQTIQSFAQRVNKHLLHIRQTGNDKLQLHFKGDGHSLKDIVFHPIATVSPLLPIQEAEAALHKLETLWIRRLATLQPMGLNFLLTDLQCRVTI